MTRLGGGGDCMPSLILPEIPQTQEHDKGESPSKRTIWGAGTARAGFVRALLQHGSYDRYYALCEDQISLNRARARLACFPNHERIELVSIDEYRKLRNVDQMILFCPDPFLHKLISLRKLQDRCDWPAIGLTHSLSPNQGVSIVLQWILGGFREHDCLVCTSDAGRKVMRNLLSHLCDELARRHRFSLVAHALRLVVIPLGVDAAGFEPRNKSDARARCKLPADATVFLYLGRFSTAYKADLFPLILAFSQLPAHKQEKAKLVLAGSDAQSRLAPKLTAFAQDLGIAEQIVVMPNVTTEEKHDLYHAADVFVSPSDNLQETFGMTIIEAMAAGLAVIASDWNGYRDTVDPGKTGLLVPTYWANCVDELSRSAVWRDLTALHQHMAQTVSVDSRSLMGIMDSFLENPSLARRMGEAGRRRAKALYDWPVIVQQYETLWGDLLDVAKKSKGDAERAHGIYTYDYTQVFGHYPTRMINVDDRLRLTRLGKLLVEAQEEVPWIAHTELASDWDASFPLLRACAAETAVEISQLVESVEGDDESASEIAFRRIARLVKYGLMEPVDALPT
jgi:glycosyltransferase involved in cell wall biosynthesis